MQEAMAGRTFRLDLAEMRGRSLRDAELNAREKDLGCSGWSYARGAAPVSTTGATSRRRIVVAYWRRVRGNNDVAMNAVAVQGRKGTEQHRMAGIDDSYSRTGTGVSAAILRCGDIA